MPISSFETTFTLVKKYGHPDADGCCSQTDKVNPPKGGLIVDSPYIFLPLGIHITSRLYAAVV